MICSILLMNCETELLIVKCERNRNVSLFSLIAVTGNNDTCIADSEFGLVVFN